MSPRLRSALSWIWMHTAAAVALLAIVLAFALGYRIGRPAAPDEPPPAPELDAAAPGEPQLYTCSMHPAVRLPDPRAKCPICFMDLIPVAADEGGEGGERRIVMSAAAAAQARVETAQVGRFFPRAEVRLFGKVTYDETSVARLTAYFSGRIERLFVNYLGVPVQQGEHLAELYSPTLLAAFEELRQAKGAGERAGGASELLQRTASDTLQAAREKLRLFGLTDEQIAAVEDGSFDSDRLTIYAPIGGVVTHLAVREGDYVQTGGPLATVADLSRLWLDLEAYESQLPLLRWGQPVRFTVEARPGEIFEGQISFIEPMVKDRTRTAAVRVAVDNSDRRLKPGMFASALVRTPVAEGGAVVGDELAGRWVSPMHPSIVRDEPGACDICGMDLVPAESLGVVGDPTAVSEPLVVPRTAVLFTGTRSVVYVAVADAERPTYEGREVLLGPRAGEFYTVREGLEEGESVVVQGAFRIDSAMQIAAKPSMMSPAGGAIGAGAHAGHGAQAGVRSPEGRAPADAPEAFLSSLQPLYSAYLDAGQHLAADDLGGFLAANADLQAALASVREVGLVGSHLGAWRRAASKLRVGQAITAIEEARARFEPVSEGMLDLVRRFGHAGDEALHLAHCPMAFDDKGADWLQRGTQIANPYFGASMLRCGEIRASFEPRSGAAPADAHEGHGEGTQDTEHAGHAEAPPPLPEDAARADLPAAFVSSLQPVYAAYLDAQEHLAADDLEAFRRAERDLQAALASVPADGLTDEPLEAWQSAASKLRSEGLDGDIEEARARFEPVSEGILELIGRFGHQGSEALHLAHCPMAFDDKGADWLQRGTRIANPYFGASMLRCGVVRASFEPIDAHAEHDGE